jgi:hypothetical protein
MFGESWIIYLPLLEPPPPYGYLGVAAEVSAEVIGYTCVALRSKLASALASARIIIK